jgi:hypothetical protein
MSATAASQVFTSVGTVGALLPADMLKRIADGKEVSGSAPADYHVVGARSVKDAAERHWDPLKGAWRALRDALGDGGHDPRGLAIQNWLLPLFEEHSFGWLQQVPGGITSDDGTVTFPVSHQWRDVPIHLVSWDADLDKRSAIGGLPPQSMLQQCLNRTEARLWGVLSNGRQLRLLRDSSSLAGTAYIEFDLEAMFDGELFDEFVLLYRLLHVSRFAVSEGAPPSACWLERWRVEAIEAGARALDQLRDGVQDAITQLGTGFLKHPTNVLLRENLDPDLYKRALLRLVYRLLFWFVAEDRDVLLAPTADEIAQTRYERYFSARRLRASALRRSGTTHGDLWQSVQLVLKALGDENGLPRLGLPGLGGIYDDTGTDQVLNGLELSNEYLLKAIRSLGRVYDTSAKRYRAVDYRNLGAEELGSIYESLLELVPKHSVADRTLELTVMAGNERKSTGAYYTPTPLVDCLLDSALNPVLDDAEKLGDVEATAVGVNPSIMIAEALLKVTVCDPACGSGHFLVAAARRIAKRLAAVREHNPEPTVEALRSAMRDVVSRCIYGVDVNPMAVELAKVSLWLEALEPGKPLSFLDAHIKCGNALLGVTPALIADGIPDDAFKPIEGDDKKWAAFLRKTNAKERSGQGELFTADDLMPEPNTALAEWLVQITEAPADSLRDVHRQAQEYRAWEHSLGNQYSHEVANAWCAAFVWPKTKDAPPAITHGRFRKLRDSENPQPLPSTTRTEVVRLQAEYNFFHWHLEFPDIFRVSEGPDTDVDPATCWSGGFACILGNPPWERIKLQEQEFFAHRDEVIARAPNKHERDKLIDALPETNPDLYNAFQTAKRRAEGESQFLRASHRYEFTARGDINTYAVFAETDRMVTGPCGRVGVIVPTGIATDATTQYFFKDLVQKASLAGLYDFENSRPLFPNVHRSYKFSLLTLAGRASREPRADFAFFLRDTTELEDYNRRFTLTPEEITLLNPNTGTCPIFRTRRDAEITLGIYRYVPVLVREDDPDGNPWGISFMRMFDMSNDASLFHTREELEKDGWHLIGNIFARDDEFALPLYQGVMANFYDHRAADVIRSPTAGKRQNQPRYLSVIEKQDPDRFAIPMYWVEEKNMPVTPDWMIGFSNVTSPTNDRTFVAYIIPKSAVGNSTPIIYVSDNLKAMRAALVAILSAFCLDYVTRQKIGGVNLNYFIVQQLPVLQLDKIRSCTRFISDRVRELVYSAYDMEGFARDLGDDGQPFQWDDERRFLIRAELDALFFRLYGIERDDVDYIMETFPIVKRKDIAQYGSYRTKEIILEFYDRMASADAAGAQYETTVSPPPGEGPRHPASSTRAGPII